MRVLRCFLACGSAAMLASGLALTAGAAGPQPAAHPPAAQRAGAHPPAPFLARARTALGNFLRDYHPQIALVHPGQLRGSASASANSYNWSGYADVVPASSLGTFTQVSATWTIPAVTCTNEDTIMSEWVGLDGWNSQTVEQAGTLGWCFQGTATYFTWWEMYPHQEVQVGSSPQPGDAISASVSRSGSTFTLALTDATHPANSFRQTASCGAQCRGTSAEWIAERPAFPIGLAPLADYRQWAVSNAQETFRGKPGTISSYPLYFAISMQDATQTYDLSTPAGLSGGSSFTTTWHNSY